MNPQMIEHTANHWNSTASELTLKGLKSKYFHEIIQQY